MLVRCCRINTLSLKDNCRKYNTNKQFGNSVLYIFSPEIQNPIVLCIKRRHCNILRCCHVGNLIISWVKSGHIATLHDYSSQIMKKILQRCQKNP